MPRDRDFPETWRPRKGDKLVGRVVRKQDQLKTKIGNSDVLTIKDREGERWTVWCGTVAMQALYDAVAKGDRVSVTFDGKERGQFGRNLYTIKINGELLEWDTADDEDDEDDDDDEPEDDDEDE